MWQWIVEDDHKSTDLFLAAHPGGTVFIIRQQSFRSPTVPMHYWTQMQTVQSRLNRGQNLGKYEVCVHNKCWKDLHHDLQIELLLGQQKWTSLVQCISLDISQNSDFSWAPRKALIKQASFSQLISLVLTVEENYHLTRVLWDQTSHQKISTAI